MAGSLLMRTGLFVALLQARWQPCNPPAAEMAQCRGCSGRDAPAFVVHPYTPLPGNSRLRTTVTALQLCCERRYMHDGGEKGSHP